MKTLFAVLIILSAPAFAKNHEIQGFHFATCDAAHCLEVSAPTGYMSQLQFSFSTSGQTEMKVTDLKSGHSTSYLGSEASYVPKLKLIVLEQADHASTVISLEDFKIENFPGLVSLSSKEKR